ENAAARGCEPRPPGSGLSVADYLAENWQRASTVHDSGAPPPDPSTPKRAVDFPMQASGNGQQGGDTEREGVIVHASTGLGVAALERQLGQGWRSVARTHAATGNSVRGDLQPKEAVWTTFHARVGASTLLVADVPAGPAGVYGAEACGDAVEGERGGWDCDATRWPGSPWRYAVAGFATVARPGDRYHLRDVDCLDGAVAGDLRAGLVDAACPAP
ncbi:MAG TPA: hypothetical protein VHH36_08030, partial [Candidatus Thermoplasmatota archaeon]|nr:hypothetical protein [Candidatus Thermoplasmatota archaeon]